MDTALSCKDEGNKSFSEGDTAGAIRAYTEGLKHASAGGDTSLTATLYTNRAVAHWKAGDAKACEEDCTSALALEPVRIKALYKRAQAYDSLGEHAKALLDLRKLCQLDTTNKEAIALARTVRDKVGKEAASQTPAKRALAELPKTPNSTAISEGQYLNALQTLCKLAEEDPNTAAVVLKPIGETDTTGLSLLWDYATSSNVKFALMALKALSDFSSHTVFGIPAVSKLYSANSTLETLDSNSGGVLAPASFSDILTSSSSTADISLAAVTLLYRVLSHDDAILKSLPSDRAGTEEALTICGASTHKTVASAWSSALSHSNAVVRDHALEGVVKWCSEPEEDFLSSTSTSDADARQAAYVQKQRRSWFARDKGLAAADVCAQALVAMLSSDVEKERRKASAAISRVVRAVAGALEADKAKERDKALLQDILKPYLQFGGDTSGMSRLEAAVRRVALATAVATGEQDIGTWAINIDGYIPEVMTLSEMTGSSLAQETSAEAMCVCASFEGGRPLLAPVVESGIIFRLMDSSSAVTRSAAASAYTKLGMISQALKGDSSDIVKLLNVSLDLLSDKVTPQEKERAIESLTFLATKTKVKEELVYGSSRCRASLDRLCNAAKDIDGRSPIAFGLATIFGSIAISMEELQAEALRGKDMTQEQYQQLQKLQEAHGQGPKGDATDESDTTDAAMKRANKLVKAGVIEALRKLTVNSSEPTLRAIARCYRILCTDPASRGAIVAKGGLSANLKLASGTDTSTVSEARHAVAKALVSTNPNLLTEAQRMDSAGCIMSMCADHNSTNLQQFEGLLALTNLASVGYEVQGTIAANKGLSTLHYLMFSDHTMVRRAATEAMLNMLAHEDTQAFFVRTPDTAKLWCAFAGLREEDRPTALAAAGGIAVIASNVEAAEKLMASDVLDTLAELLQCGDEDLAHRAAAAIIQLASHESTAEQVLSSGSLCEALAYALRTIQPTAPAFSAITRASEMFASKALESGALGG